MPTDLSYLRRLYQLRQAALGKQGGIDTTQLEKDFLSFSAYSQSKTLVVKRPRMLTLDGDGSAAEVVQDQTGPTAAGGNVGAQARHLTAAISAAGGKEFRVPAAIDISGDFPQNPVRDGVFFVSLRQAAQTDMHSNSRAFLLPLLEEIYDKGRSLLTDFTLHEVVFGKYTLRRGALDLTEAHIFPERFLPGPYIVEAHLDTPTQAIKRFKDLNLTLEQIAKDPRKGMLDSALVDDATERALDLRKMLGSLSRYAVPEIQRFQATVNSVHVKDDKGSRFYLYHPESKQNILVYFGDAPFEATKEPKDLLVLKGKDHQDTLAKLLELGFYTPSLPVLEQRIQDMQSLYDTAARGAGQSLQESAPDFQGLLSILTDAKNYFTDCINPQMRVKYAERLPAEILEFLVCPASNDPVIHELLPRLSWSKTVRNYSNTPKFLSVFEAATQDEKVTMLRELGANVLFANQQNIEVNNILNDKYHNLCTIAHLNFDVRE